MRKKWMRICNYPFSLLATCWMVSEGPSLALFTNVTLQEILLNKISLSLSNLLIVQVGQRHFPYTLPVLKSSRKGGGVENKF